jgi:hypothetical protein
MRVKTLYGFADASCQLLRRKLNGPDVWLVELKEGYSSPKLVSYHLGSLQ